MDNEFRAKFGQAGHHGSLSASQSAPISFGDHFQASEQFDSIFKEGMALVERTASYLDGDGRRDAKGLSALAIVLYATESMRLTTRLLDIASWLLVRRALKQGELSEGEARHKRQSIKLMALGRPSHTKGFEELPAELRDLIAESFAMLDRILKLDRAMTSATPETVALVGPANPVGAQHLTLKAAFKPKLV